MGFHVGAVSAAANFCIYSFYNVTVRKVSCCERGVGFVCKLDVGVPALSLCISRSVCVCLFMMGLIISRIIVNA